MDCQCKDLHSRMVMLHFKEDMLTPEIVSTMAMFSEPEQVFPLVFSLKEEGNMLVRSGKIEQAYSVYTKSISFLVLGLPCCSDNCHPFKDLAIPLNLNIAMCALKLSNFRWAKSLCDCILQFDPTNVKALFRRAMATLNLGWLVAAKNDLLVARKIEPNNSEVLREWNKVTHLLKHTVTEDGSSLSYASMDVDSKTDAPTARAGARKLGFNPLNLPPKKISHFADQTGFESVNSNLNEVCSSNLSGSEVNFAVILDDPPKVNSELEDTSSNLGSSSPPFKSNLAELKRFSNQSRPGSILNLSPPDYKKLVDGRVLHYFYPHSTSFMSVRVKSSINNPATSCQIEKSESSVAMNLDNVKVVDDNFSNIHREHCEKVCGSNDSGISPVYSIKHSSPASSQTPSIFNERFSNKQAKSSGLVITKTVRHHPFVPSFNRSVDNRRIKRAAKRATPKRVKPVLGMKRKGVSNVYVSSYPKWKKRASCDWENKAQVVGDCDQISLYSSVIYKDTSWVDISLHPPRTATSSYVRKMLAVNKET